jgi:predicted nucleic acid-binding protein
MATKIFLDTNIILDLLDEERIFNKESKILFEGIETGRFLAYFSESVVTTTDYILIKKYTHAQRLSILEDLLKILTIVKCTNEIVQHALQNIEGDIEDAILYELAITEKIDYFITNDKKTIKKLATKKLPIVSTKDFLKFLKD